MRATPGLIGTMQAWLRSVKKAKSRKIMLRMSEWIPTSHVLSECGCWWICSGCSETWTALNRPALKSGLCDKLPKPRFGILEKTQNKHFPGFVWGGKNKPDTLCRAFCSSFLLKHIWDCQIKAHGSLRVTAFHALDANRQAGPRESLLTRQNPSSVSRRQWRHYFWLSGNELSKSPVWVYSTKSHQMLGTVLFSFFPPEGDDGLQSTTASLPLFFCVHSFGVFSVASAIIRHSGQPELRSNSHLQHSFFRGRGHLSPSASTRLRCSFTHYLN